MNITRILEKIMRLLFPVKSDVVFFLVFIPSEAKTKKKVLLRCVCVFYFFRLTLNTNLRRYFRFCCNSIRNDRTTVIHGRLKFSEFLCE